jgi:hypothetical protein
MDDEAGDRKARSEALLVGYGVPFNPYLPAIETQDEISFRTGADIMHRAMALFVASYAAIHGSVGTAHALIDRWMIADKLSPFERAFLFGDGADDRSRIQLSWRCEALAVLMWAIGLIERMPFPDGTFDFSSLAEFWLPLEGTSWDHVVTRSPDEILDQADLIYRFHWAVRDAQLLDNDPPAGIDAGVVMERHHALNWLIGYDEAEWDDIATDT